MEHTTGSGSAGPRRRSATLARPLAAPRPTVPAALPALLLAALPGARGTGDGVILASRDYGRVDVSWTLGDAGEAQALEIFAVGYAGDTARATVRATAITTARTDVRVRVR